MRHLHNLDLMRSFAVLLVLLDHTGYALGHLTVGSWDLAFVGVFGVYLFFVHTCLVLMGSMEKNPNVLGFYIRRAFRIYPLAIAAVLASLVIPVWVGGPTWEPIHFTGSTILTNLLLIQDVMHRRNMVGVLWTLTIEVQMYVMLPALFYLASKTKQIWPMVMLWVLAVVELHAYYPAPSNILPTVIPDFIPGVIAYLAFKKYPARFPGWAFMPLLLVLLGLYMYSPSPARSWPLMLVLAFLLPLFRQIESRWLVIASQRIAMYSYGIYLWHSFAIKLAFNSFPHRPAVFKVGIELGLTAVASVASYHAIEAPLIRFGSRLANKITIDPKWLAWRHQSPIA